MNQETLLQVHGMDCANCAMTITRTLEKEGLSGVKVDFTSGEVRFQETSSEQIDRAVKAVNTLGYRVTERSDKISEASAGNRGPLDEATAIPLPFVLCVLLTLPLMGHMVSSWHLLHNGWFQFVLCTPVMMVGWMKFGRSAWKSVTTGVPNMDVLVTIGSSAAYFYSLLLLLQTDETGPLHETHYFFETAASIITLILLGNLIEQRSVRKTTSSLRALKRLQPDKARKITLLSGVESVEEIPAEKLRKGDVVLVSEGSRVPADGEIIEGTGVFDESMMTGEPLPVSRAVGQRITSGTLCAGGSVRLRCEATGNASTLARIISLVRDAQHDKPRIQRIGDRISAVFVPVVVAISVATFFLSHFVFGMSLQDSIMHAIAVLVISCPCAMGLATPTAVVVGIGRAAREGVLFKGGKTVEELAKADIFVFDKTGTLTTGDFEISGLEVQGVTEQELLHIVYSLELESNHPIAQSLVNSISKRDPALRRIHWKRIQEDKGIGIHGWTAEGDLFSAGSYLMVAHLGIPDEHAVYVTRNNVLIGSISLKDQVKPGASELILELASRGKRVVLMSGDQEERCLEVAAALGIHEVHARMTPAGKLDTLKRLSESGTTAMTGDGINDAPALAAAGIGISMSGATDVAVDSAQVVLLHKNDLSKLIQAWKISTMTYHTIRQNLFWAFIYNIIAIPFAAAGHLDPMFGAISMAVSDVVVIGNSLRLNYRRIR